MWIFAFLFIYFDFFFRVDFLKNPRALPSHDVRQLCVQRVPVK